MIKAINIKWDTDDEKVDLPSEVDIPEVIITMECEDSWDECESNIESVNNYLSDTYGWCVFNYNLTNATI